MEERSTGLIPEKTDQSNTDVTPQKQIVLSILGGLTRKEINIAMENPDGRLFQRDGSILRIPTPVKPRLLCDSKQQVLKYGCSLESFRSLKIRQEKSRRKKYERDMKKMFYSLPVPYYKVIMAFLEKYEPNIETKLNSRPIGCYYKNSQIRLLLGRILALIMDMKQLLSNVNVSKNVIKEKNLIEETLKKFIFLSRYVPKDFPGCSASGCNELQSQLLEDCKRLRSLIGEVWQQHKFKCNTCDDDSIQTSPALSTKDGIEMNHLPGKSIDIKPFYGVKADPKGKGILEPPGWYNSNKHNLETAEWNYSLRYSNDSQTKKLPEYMSNSETKMPDYMIDSGNILDKCHTVDIQKFKTCTEFHEKPSSSGCKNPQLEPLQNLERFKSHRVRNAPEENEAAQCALSYSTHTVQENEAAQNDQEISSAAQGDEGGLSCSHRVVNITQENEATTQDEGGFSGPRHAISTTRKIEAVQDDQKMSNRCNIIIVSRRMLSFVKENIAELLPYFGVQFTLLGALGHPSDLKSHDKETSPPLSLEQAFSLFRGLMVWSAMFFLITTCTAIRIGSLRRRVFATSMQVLCLVYYVATVASATTEYSVICGSATMPSFWFVFGGGALGFVLVFLLVLGCFLLFQLI